jgi:hypothetical protein
MLHIDFSARNAYFEALEACWLSHDNEPERCSPLHVLLDDVWPAFGAAAIAAAGGTGPWQDDLLVAGIEAPRSIDELRAGTAPELVRLRQALEVWALRFHVADDWVLDGCLHTLAARAVDPDFIDSPAWVYEGGAFNPPLALYWNPLADGVQNETPENFRPAMLRSLARFESDVRRRIKVMRRGILYQSGGSDGDGGRKNFVLAQRFVLRQQGKSLSQIARAGAESPRYVSSQTVSEAITEFAVRTGSKIPSGRDKKKSDTF